MTPIPASRLALRLVLDTNVWLDWLVFDDPAVSPVKAAVAEGRAAVYTDDAVEAELARVLAYPFGARSLGAQAQAAALEQCRGVSRKVEGGRVSRDFEERACARSSRRTPDAMQRSGPGSLTKDDLVSLPRCDDPDDQKFLELALACEAAFLLTRDDALLELGRSKARPLPFRIVTPMAFVTET